MAASGAFSEYSSADRLEAASLPPTGSALNPLVALTRGLTAVLPGRGAAAGAVPGPAQPAAAAQQHQRLTLPDGHLNVGTHLPLLAGRYKYLSTLGEGVSSRVILAEDTLAAAPGKLVAVKVMRRQHAAAGQKEARALRYLHSSAPGGTAPGVVRLLDSFSLGAHFCLVTERLFPWLLDWIADSSALPAAEALSQLRKIAHQLLVAVAFLHNCGLVNGDIKPDNLLLQHPPGSSSVGLRLVDFGACFSLTETDTQAVGCEVQTLPWRAPEAALGLPYGAAIDCWGCGVVLAEMALRRMLLPCTTPRDLLHQMAALLGPLPEGLVAASPMGQHIDLSALCRATPGGSSAAAAGRALPPELAQRASAAAAASGSQGVPPRAAGSPLYAELAAVDPQLADLVLGLLAYDPAQRLTAHQALLHPFFDPLCPLRAVFPQLEQLCRVQQAALLTESADGMGAAPGAGERDAAAVAAAAAAGARSRAVGPPLQQPVPPAPAAVAAPRPVAAHQRAAGKSGGAAAAAAAAAATAAAADTPAEVKPAASPWTRFAAGLPSPEVVAAAAAAEAAAAEDAALASAAAAGLHGPARRQQHGTGGVSAVRPQWDVQQQEQQQQVVLRQQRSVHELHQQQPQSAAQRSPHQQAYQGVQPEAQQHQHQHQHQQQQQQHHGTLPSRAPLDEPWRKLSAALAQPAAPQSRLPAVQLAAEIAAEQRRLAASNPYAGSFSPHFEGETPLKPSPQAEQPAGQQRELGLEQRYQQQQQQQQQRQQQQQPRDQTPAGPEQQQQQPAPPPSQQQGVQQRQVQRSAQQPQRPQREQQGPRARQLAGQAEEWPGESDGMLQPPSAAKPAPASRSRKAQQPAADGTAAKAASRRRSGAKLAAAAAAAGPAQPPGAADGAGTAAKRSGASRQQQRKAPAAGAAALAQRAEDGARAFDLLLEAAAVEDGVDGWAAGTAGAAGQAAGERKLQKLPASAKKPRKQPAAAAAAPAADAKPRAIKPQAVKRQRPKQGKAEQQTTPEGGERQQQQQQQQPRSQQQKAVRPHSAAASSAKPRAGATGAAAAGAAAAGPSGAASKAGSSKKPRSAAAPAPKQPQPQQPQEQKSQQAGVPPMQPPAAAAKPRKNPAAAAGTPAAQQGGSPQPAAAPKRKRDEPAGPATGEAGTPPPAPAAAAAAEAPSSPLVAAATGGADQSAAVEPTIPATAKRQRRERPADAKPWWCV